jgi:hypothetical protein
MTFEEITSKVISEYPKNVLEDLLPNQMIVGLSSANDCLENFELNSKNKYYETSDYFFNPNEKQFIHFTSFDKFKEIISNNKLRLYDLNYADDPHEIVFTIKSAGIDFDKLKYHDLKSKLFSISFCNYKLNDDDEHNMWRLYGKDGTGVGLVFSFHNDCKKWDYFNLSKIYYDKSNKIAEAFSKHKIFFQNLNASNEYRSKIDEDALIYNILQLFAFHKHSIYKSENEFRLLYRFNRYMSQRNSLRRIFTINKANRLSSYIELNLFNNKNDQDNIENSNNSLPLIKLDKLVLGYRYSEKEKNEIEKVIREVYAYNDDIYNYMTLFPKVEITSLKEKYFN